MPTKPIDPDPVQWLPLPDRKQVLIHLERLGNRGSYAVIAEYQKAARLDSLAWPD